MSKEDEDAFSFDVDLIHMVNLILGDDDRDLPGNSETDLTNTTEGTAGQSQAQRQQPKFNVPRAQGTSNAEEYKLDPSLKLIWDKPAEPAKINKPENQPGQPQTQQQQPKFNVSRAEDYKLNSSLKLIWDKPVEPAKRNKPENQAGQSQAQQQQPKFNVSSTEDYKLDPSLKLIWDKPAEPPKGNKPENQPGQSQAQQQQPKFNVSRAEDYKLDSSLKLIWDKPVEPAKRTKPENQPGILAQSQAQQQQPKFNVSRAKGTSNAQEYKLDPSLKLIWDKPAEPAKGNKPENQQGTSRQPTCSPSCAPECIFGVTKIFDTSLYIVKWPGSPEKKFIPTETVERKWPDLVRKFHEEVIWVRKK